MEQEKRWLCPDELEEVYRFKRKTQDKLRMNKKIPFSKIGKYIRYDRFEIDKWIEANTVVRLQS